MKTIKTLGYVGAGGIAIALLVPAMGIAEQASQRPLLPRHTACSQSEPVTRGN